jgi:predicted ATPase
LAIAQTTGERWYLPELLRLRGAINLDMGETQAAIRDLRGSIDLALGLDARFWALRSASLLARLLEDSGQGEEAVAILSPVLKSFTEGLDTSDLHEAKALLRSLRGGEG